MGVWGQSPLGVWGTLAPVTLLEVRRIHPNLFSGAEGFLRQHPLGNPAKRSFPLMYALFSGVW